MRKTSVFPNIAVEVARLVLERLEPIFKRLDQSAETLSSRIADSEPTLDVAIVDVGPNPVAVVRELFDLDIGSLSELNSSIKKGIFKVARGLNYGEANHLADRLRYWEAEVLIVPSGMAISSDFKRRQGFFTKRRNN